MKINEVILTEAQLDELNLKGLGTGLGKAVGGIAGGAVQGAKNIWSGMKQGYAGAQQALAPDNGSGTPQPAPQTATGGQQTPAPQTTPATQTATSGQTDTSQGGTPAPATDGQQQAAQGQQTPAPQSAPATDGQQQAAPAQDPAKAEQQAKIGVGQINKIIPTLRTRDLQSVKKNVDATLTKKQAAPAQGQAPAAQPAPAQQQAPAAQPAPEEDDNPNIVRGYNENKVVKFESKFLGMAI